MKKTILFIIGIFLNILLSCYSGDPKNEEEPYPNYDTAKPMEYINDPDTASEGVSLPNRGLSGEN